MSLYDKIMRRGEDAAPGAGAVTEDVATVDLPDLTPESYADLFQPSGAPTVTSTDSGVPQQRIGQGPLANKMLPMDEAGNGRGAKIVKAAESLVGLPYVWGGASTTKGVDCSGLVMLAYQAAGINLPRVSADQARSGRRVALGDLQPGDLVAWDNSSRNNGADHIAVYMGGGRIIEAPKPGEQVRIRKLGSNEGAWGVRILGGN